MINLIDGVRRSGSAAEDVIVVLDGDDWLYDDAALETIAGTYARHDCWMTYGSWMSNDPAHTGMQRGLWPAYADDVVDFRRATWLHTAVRTWKRWLWQRIDDRDFRDDDGLYFTVTEDQASAKPDRRDAKQRFVGARGAHGLVVQAHVADVVKAERDHLGWP